MTFINIHRKFLPNGHCLKSSKWNELKIVSRNLIIIICISIVFEILGIAVKMVRKMTFGENCRF